MNSQPSRRPKKSHVSQERWLVSFADFMTLIFALFVVLYATSKADLKKQAKAAHSIDSAFSALGLFASASRDPAKSSTSSATDEAVIPMNIVMGEDVLSPAKVKNDLDHIRVELEQKLSNQVATHSVSIQMGRDGLVISLREAGFFSSGSATPKPDSLATLHQIADSLGKTPYDLRIEGHTDNIPIHTGEFDSNWELSSARATRVARVFLDQDRFPAEHLSAAGYAEFHPVASNETDEGRAKNRRIDLVVLPRTRINFSTNGSTHSTSGTWRKITDDDPVTQSPAATK
jgi:chemotaxis protein MotB